MKEYTDKKWPLYYKGEKYTQENSDEIFLCFYHEFTQLNTDCGVYIGEDTWVYPDGSMGEW